MKDASILDGDFVVVRAQESAGTGDIVAARIGDEATVKRFEKSAGGIRLLPANAAFSPIDVEPGEDFAVLGRVVGVYRRL